MSLAGRLGARVDRGNASRARRPASSTLDSAQPEPAGVPAKAADRRAPASPQPSAAPKPRASSRPTDEKAIARHLDLNFQIHNKLFEVLDLAAVEEISQEHNAEDVAQAVRKILDGVTFVIPPAKSQDDRRRSLTLRYTDHSSI